MQFSVPLISAWFLTTVKEKDTNSTKFGQSFIHMIANLFEEKLYGISLLNILMYTVNILGK